MMKRFLAMFLALVMVVSVLPMDAFAASYGRDMGWDYAVITEKTGGGFNMTNPTGSNHLGSHVTVTYNNNNTSTNWVEGTLYDRVLSSTQSDATVTIACDFGYYITDIIVACGNNSRTPNPFSCRTTGSESAYGMALPESSVPTVFVLDMDDLYAMTDHTSRDEDYFLLVEIAPLPGSIYVGYSAGVAGTTAITAAPVAAGSSVPNATKNGNFPTWGYTVADFNQAPAHTTLGISPEAEAQANALGYSFAGWQLTYYNDYSATSNAFSNSNGVGRDNVRKGEAVSVYTDALLTAIWAPMITINVEKVWDDADDQDGARPDGLKVHLVAGTEHTGDVLTLNDANDWKGSWLVPSVDENGNAIQYFAEEETIEGYEASAPTITTSSDGKTISYLFKNTHTPGTTDISVLKNWDDNYNQDGLRTDFVWAVLLANGVEVERVKLDAANRWFHTWTNMDTHANGEKIEYTIIETDSETNQNEAWPEGYTVSYIQGAQQTGLYEIINKHETYETSFKVTKVWDENGNTHRRPGSIQVQLYANGEAVPNNDDIEGEIDGLVTLSGEGWTYTWTGLPQKANGTNIVYTVREVTAHVYYTSNVSEVTTTGTDGNITHSATITNTYINETTDITVNKVWDDKNNQDGLRPASVELNIMNGTTVVTSVTLSAANNWTATVLGLPKYDNGNEITYTVDEPTVPTGYTKSVSGFTVTNTHVPATTAVTVEKVWDDAGHVNLRPASVKIHLLANGEHTGEYKILTAENNWTYTWTDLPEKAAGNVIEYSVLEEIAVSQSADSYYYIPSYSYDAVNDKFVVTNKITNHETTVTVEKVWDDVNNRYNSRPVDITVYLIINGVRSSDPAHTVKLTAGHHWTYSFEALPRFDQNGVEIEYTVGEEQVAGYKTPVITEDTSSQINENYFAYVITNTYDVERIRIPVEKVWNDKSNQDGIRPSEIVVDLYYCSDGTNWLYSGKSLKLNASGDWKGEFTNVLKQYGNQDIQYYVVEQAAEGYTIAISGNPANPTGGFTITNTHIPETIDIPVKKVWVDNDNQDNYRPVEITVSLLANGTKVAELKLNAANLGEGVFKDQPKYANGKKINYTVEEAPFEHSNEYVAETSYTLDTTDNTIIAEDGFIITNTHETETIKLVINKQWDDENDRDLLRPESIRLWLVQSGGSDSQARYVPIDLTAEGGWTATVGDLPKYHNGQRIIYTVLEITQEGYSAAYEYAHANNVTTVTLTNTHKAEHVTVAVEKVWDDVDDRDGIRPDSVTVTLFANGESTGKTVTLSAEHNWVGQWTGLTKWYMKNGERTEIEYTVEESPVEGYTPSITVDEHVGIVRLITNTHKPETTKVVVSKTWDDENDKAGIRPDDVQVQLYANDKPVGHPVVLNADNGWSWTWNDMFVNENGEAIVYKVQEIAVPEHYTAVYHKAVKSNGTTKLVIMNSTDYVPQTADEFDLPLRMMLFFGSAVALAMLLITDKKPRRRGRYAR